ncbi:hypothetical protein K439DRAFT_1664220, partial [Ramaria rubella]
GVREHGTTTRRQEHLQGEADRVRGGYVGDSESCAVRRTRLSRYPEVFRQRVHPFSPPRPTPSGLQLDRSCLQAFTPLPSPFTSTPFRPSATSFCLQVTPKSLKPFRRQISTTLNVSSAPPTFSYQPTALHVVCNPFRPSGYSVILQISYHAHFL